MTLGIEVTLRILLAVDSEDLRLSLELLIRQELGLSVVGTASEARGLLALVETTKPDVIVMNQSLKGAETTEVLSQTRSCHPQARIVVIGLHDEDRNALTRAGANSFVPMGEGPAELLKALHQKPRAGTRPPGQGRRKTRKEAQE
jgi:DNA-binding NarL/FixJ family response regulator